MSRSSAWVGWHALSVNSQVTSYNGRRPQAVDKSQRAPASTPTLSSALRGSHGDRVPLRTYLDGEVDDRNVCSAWRSSVSSGRQSGLSVCDGPEAVMNQYIFKVESFR